MEFIVGCAIVVTCVCFSTIVPSSSPCSISVSSDGTKAFPSIQSTHKLELRLCFPDNQFIESKRRIPKRYKSDGSGKYICMVDLDFSDIV